MSLIAERSEEAVGASDSRTLDHVFASSPDLIAIYDREGRFLYVSPPLARTLQRREAELVGHSWREVGDLPPAVMECFDQDRQAVLMTGHPLTNEVGLDTPRGFRRYEYALSPIRDGDAHIHAIVAQVRDVTDRKVAEEERERLLTQIAAEREHAHDVAEDAEQRAIQLNAVFEAMDEAVNVYDARGVLIHANPASVHTFGFDPMGMTREQLAERLVIRHPDGRPLDLAALPASRALQGERVSRERILFTDGRGRERVALVSIAPLLHDGGITGAVGVWDDVTDLEQALAELDTERGRLEAVVEQMPAAVLIAEASSGRVVLMNRRAREMLNNPGTMAPTVAELVRYPHQLLLPNGHAYHPDEAPLARALHQGEVIVGDEAELVAPDGTRCALSINAGPIRDRHGHIIAAVSTFYDITDRKRAEQERDQARQRLLDAEREKRRFYRDVIRALTHGRFCLSELGDLPAVGDPVFETPLDGEESYRALREHIREAAMGAGMSDERARELVLAAGEGITNAIKHGTDGHAGVYVSAEAVIVRVSDRGLGLRSENLPATLFTRGFSTKVSLGMGYTIMLQFADKVWLATGLEGTTLQLEKLIHPQPQPDAEMPVAWDRL